MNKFSIKVSLVPGNMNKHDSCSITALESIFKTMVVTYVTSKRLSHMKNIAYETLWFISKQSYVLLDLIYIRLKTTGHL